jgi:hypothetical protein
MQVKDCTIRAAMIKFCRSAKECSKHTIRYEDTRTELRIFSLNTKTEDYRDKLMEHLQSMNDLESPRGV